MKKIETLAFRDTPNTVAWSADASRLAVLSNFGGRLTVYDVRDWRKTHDLEIPGSADGRYSLAFANDKNVLTPSSGAQPKDWSFCNLSNTVNGFPSLGVFSILQWNLDTKRPTVCYPADGALTANTEERAFPSNTFSISNNIKLIASITRAARRNIVVIFDANSGRKISRVEIPKSKNIAIPRSVVFSPDGKLLAVGATDGHIYLFDLDDFSLKSTVDVSKDPMIACSALAFSPDGSLIVAGEAKNYNLSRNHYESAAIVRVADGQVIHSIPGPTSPVGKFVETSPVRSVAWGGSGKKIAIGDGLSLSVWTVDGGEPALNLRISEAYGFSSVAFSPDGELAAANAKNVSIFR